MHAGDVYDLVQEGNELAIQIMEDAYEYLSNFISILYGVLDPDLFVLSGSVALKMKLVRGTDPVHPDAVTSGCDRGDSTTS